MTRYTLADPDRPAPSPWTACGSGGQAPPVLCLFHGAADARVLGRLSTVATAPQQFRHRTAAYRVALLDRAADLGLVTAVGAGMYTIHPALPAYLAARWQHRPDYPDQRAATEAALLDACAAFSAAAG